MSVLKQRCRAMLDLARHEHMHLFDILDGDKVVGVKTVHIKPGAAATVMYQLPGAAAPFESAEAFIAAYQARKAKDRAA